MPTRGSPELSNADLTVSSYVLTQSRHCLTSINVKLTNEEVELLASLASDQMFRREFIDPKRPGYRANPGALRLGKQLVERLQGIADQSNAPSPLKKSTRSAKRPAGAANKKAVR